MISKEEFLQLPAQEVTRLVRAGGSKVIVFPFNGTRRWFLLEHGRDNHADPAQAYVDSTSQAYVHTYKMLFDHGLDTIIAPIFGGDILKRGTEYMEQIGVGMRLLAEHTYFLDFYEKYNVRVHFYGDYRRELSKTPYAFLTDIFDDLTQKTAKNTACRLFYGVFGSDATETIAEFSVAHHQKNNRIPNRRELIEYYYGEHIGQADIFIGFEKFNVFDYPLLGWGEESLYFTAAPSLFINETLLRGILYDFLFLRPLQEPDYFTMPKGEFEAMRSFYAANRNVAFGIGEMRGGIWYPKSGVME